MKRQRHAASEQDTIDAGIELASLMTGGIVVALEGPLGAGKTCLARGVAMGLGVDARSVASPTFAILHEHAAVGVSDVTQLYHIDAYRLSGPQDLESIGWSEILEDSRGVVLVEWATRIEAVLPKHAWWIDMSYDASDGRLLELRTPCDSPGVERVWDEAGDDSGVGGS